MRVLGIDPGTKRIGLALSDEMAMIALPLEFVPAEPQAAAFDRIKQLIAEKSIAKIVVGMPRNMDGTYGPAAEKTNAFIAQLKTVVTVPIKTWDERLTSAQANRVLIESGMRREKRKTKVDQTAAAILLQSFLDSETQTDHRL
jgi:putative Holliday junction resolvase